MLSIEKNSIPALADKVAVVTGGSSGIGLAVARLLLQKGATVHIIDPVEADEDDEGEDWKQFVFHQGDVRDWNQLRHIFDKIGPLDFAFANAGRGGLDDDLLDDGFDESGNLLEPEFPHLDTNIRGVFYTIKLAWFYMRKYQRQGSIVLTCASTGYWPDYQVPIYAATSASHYGIIRALRNVLPEDNITINGVAAGATITRMMPYDFAVPLFQLGVPVNSSEAVALALVYSATARESRRVEIHGKESSDVLHKDGRWNGRVILVLGDEYKETEEILADNREVWFGKKFCKWTKLQQAATDFRPSGDAGSSGGRVDC